MHFLYMKYFSISYLLFIKMFSCFQFLLYKYANKQLFAGLRNSKIQYKIPQKLLLQLFNNTKHTKTKAQFLKAIVVQIRQNSSKLRQFTSNFLVKNFQFVQVRLEKEYKDPYKPSEGDSVSPKNIDISHSFFFINLKQ